MPYARVTPRVAVALDAAVAAGFSLLALTEIGLRWDDGYSAGPPVLNVPLLVLVTLPLVLRRRAPWVALTTAFGAVVLPSLFVGHTLFFFGGLLPLALLVYSAARWVARRSWVVLLAPLALIAAYPLHVPPFGAADYTFVSALFTSAWGIGRLIRRLEDQRRRLGDTRHAVFAWIIRYNTRWRHSTCGQLGPFAYETGYTPTALQQAA